MLKTIIRDIGEINEIQLEEIVLKLPKYRQDKINSLNERQTKMQSILAGLILHDEFGDKDKLIKVNESGQETLDDHFFSISHSGTKVMVVFSDKPIGCDIEKIRKIDLEIAKRFFTNEEYNELLKSKNPDINFIKYWTIKESALKCLGTGLTRSLNTVLVKNLQLENEEVALLECKENNGYVYSICEKKRR